MNSSTIMNWLHEIPTINISTKVSGYVDPKITFDTSETMEDAESTSEHCEMNLTLGVELEFLLAVSTYPFEATADTMRLANGLSLVRTVLAQPMTAKCASCNEWHAFKLRVNTRAGADPENWVVEGDSSLYLKKDEIAQLGYDCDYFHFYPVEGKSRVLHHQGRVQTTAKDQKTGHAHEIGCFQEIDAVLRRIREMSIKPEYPPGSSKAFAIINETCSLHVHVGNEDRGFLLPTVKKILSSYVANEKAIDGLHAAQRIGGSMLVFEPPIHPPFNLHDPDMAPRPYNSPWSKHLIQIAYELRRRDILKDNLLAYAFEVSNGTQYTSPEPFLEDSEICSAAFSYSAADWLEVIDRASSLSVLQNLQNGWTHNSTLNLSNLGDYSSKGCDPDGRMMTVEFRQHAGTLDSADVRAWIDVVVRIVQHTHDTPDADFKELCATEWQSPGYHPIHLLKTIKCSDKTIRHYSRQLGREISRPTCDVSIIAKEVDDLELFPEGNLIRPLLVYLDHKRAQSLLPTSVVPRIYEKFIHGGYGQFSPEYLNHFDWSGAEDSRDKLTIGWTNDPPSFSPYGDD